MRYFYISRRKDRGKKLLPQESATDLAVRGRVHLPSNKALQLTVNPLRGLTAAELGR